MNAARTDSENTGPTNADPGSAGPAGTGNALRTARLRLRPLTSAEADIEAWVALHADPRVNGFVGSYTREAAVARLERVERQWAERGHGLFAVESLADGRFLGRAGLQYWEEWDEVEAGWVFGFEAQGHGYAAEAASAFLEWGWRNLDVTSVTAMIAPANTASIRLAERLGFTLRIRAERMGYEVLVYHALRPAAPR
jgi:RimJ/RimL family protein N-acetyltransferase